MHPLQLGDGGRVCTLHELQQRKDSLQPCRKRAVPAGIQQSIVFWDLDNLWVPAARVACACQHVKACRSLASCTAAAAVTCKRTGLLTPPAHPQAVAAPCAPVAVLAYANPHTCARPGLLDALAAAGALLQRVSRSK